MKRHFRYFCIVLFTILSICLISNVSATWNIHRQIDNGYKFVDSSTQNYYTISLKYITTEPNLETTESNNSTIHVDETTNLLKGDNAIWKEWDSRGGVGKYVDEIEPKTTITGENGETITTWKEHITIITQCSKTSTWKDKTFKVDGTAKDVSYKLSTKRNIGATVISNYLIKKDSLFTKPKLTRNGYTLAGFFNATTDGLNTDNTLFDFSKPITKNLTIFAEWLAISSDKNLELTKFVNACNNGSFHIFNANNASFNISNDDSFNSYTTSVNLGSSSLNTTIQSGAIVNFCMNNGETDIQARLEESITDPLLHTVGPATSGYASNDQYISLDFYEGSNQKNPKDYTIVLQNDLIVNGQMYIGGYTGSSYQFAGYIIKNYVSLDLNGHSLIINDGGMVHSFGLITDSIGTGSIEVMPGGNLKTPFVLDDMKGGNTTLWGYSKGICPFENYRFPYLECKVKFHVNNTKAGSLDIFTKLNLGSLGVTNIYIPFIGYGSSYLVSCQSSLANANFMFEPYDLSVLNTKNDSLRYNMTYRKYSFTFENLIATVNAISIKASVYIEKTVVITIKISKTFDLNLDRVIFPISSAMDLDFKNSTFSVSQQIKLMPGSTLTMDKNSILDLNYYKDSSGNTKKSFSDIVVQESVVKKTLPGETKALSGSITALNRPLSSKTGTNYQNVPYSFYGIFGGGYSLYWQYFQEAIVNIYGTVNFNSGNDAPYELSGFMNINQFTINGNNPQKFNAANISSLNSSVKLQTYSFDLEIASCIWFEGNDILNRDNNSSISSANHFYIQPLVSKDVAYYKEATSSNVITGKFDQYSGIFTKDSGTQAFFYTDNNLLAGSSTESAFNQTASLKDCTYDESFHGITSEGIRYIYYAGIWCPIVEDATIPAKAEIVVNTSKLVHNKEKYTDTSYSYATTPFAYNTTYKAWRVTY